MKYVSVEWLCVCLCVCMYKQLPDVVMMRERFLWQSQPVTQGQSLKAVLVVLIVVLIVLH